MTASGMLKNLNNHCCKLFRCLQVGAAEGNVKGEILSLL